MEREKRGTTDAYIKAAMPLFHINKTVLGIASGTVFVRG